MVWPQKVVRQFELAPPSGDENAYGGPWNKLLYTLFPADSDFTVIPNFEKLDFSQGTDFWMTIDVHIENKPVLIVDLRKPSNIRYVSRREDADMQLRRRLRDLTIDCPLPIIYGISAFGTQVCFYSLNTAPRSVIDPPIIPRDRQDATDTAPKGRWSDNVLSATGEDKLRQIVNEIYEACLTL